MKHVRKTVASTFHARGKPMAPKLGDGEKSELTCRCCDTTRGMLIGCTHYREGESNVGERREGDSRIKE
jgi:hypothetical protein